MFVGADGHKFISLVNVAVNVSPYESMFSFCTSSPKFELFANKEVLVVIFGELSECAR